MKLPFRKKPEPAEPPVYDTEEALRIIGGHLDDRLIRYYFFQDPRQYANDGLRGGMLFPDLSESPTYTHERGEPFYSPTARKNSGRPLPTKYAEVFDPGIFPYHVVDERILHPDKVYPGNPNRLVEYRGQNIYVVDPTILKRMALLGLEGMLTSFDLNPDTVLGNKAINDVLKAEIEALELTQPGGCIAEGKSPAEIKEQTLGRSRKIFGLRPPVSEKEAVQFARGANYLLKLSKQPYHEIPKAPSEREMFFLGMSAVNSTFVDGLPYPMSLQSTVSSVVQACEAGGRDPKVFGRAVLEMLYTSRHFVYDLEHSMTTDMWRENNAHEVDMISDVSPPDSSNTVCDLKVTFKGTEIPLPTRLRVGETEEYISLAGGYYWEPFVENLRKLGLLLPK